jgi:ABC-2 type transport system permease protein
MVKRGKNILTNRRDAVIRLLLALTVVVLVNVVASFYYYRLDLTAEKKYSISKPSKQLVKELKDVVTVKVYLDGDLNAGFTRLKESTRNLLNELRAYGGNNIEFEFVDPMGVENLDQRKALMEELIQRGIAPTNVTTKAKAESTQQLVFPGALVSYGGRTVAVQLLENQIGFSPQEILNNSVISLEYKFANAIKKLTQFKNPRVAFLTGNGELGKMPLADIKGTLSTLQYEVKDYNINEHYNIPSLFDVVIVAKPTMPFDDKAKYKIDQYIMRGGKVLWLIDGTNAEMDSLRNGPEGQYAQELDLGLDDMLFKYGVRVNNDVVQDINYCNQIPIVVGVMGNAPQTEMFPWYYFPLFVPNNEHAIVRNLDPIAGYFSSTVDTIRNKGVKKTVLLHTSPNSKAVPTPTRVHFGILQQKPNPVYFNQPNLPTAVLLEGEFQSSFANNVTPAFLAATDTIAELKFMDKSKTSKMIVIGDGDVIANQYEDSSAYPLGYYKYTKQTFANKDFLVNCVEYLTDDKGILETRNKEIKLRLLNNVAIEESKTMWQIINVAVPVIVVVLFGLLFGFLRKRKYA